MPDERGRRGRAVVVGGGVAGLACATALAERGHAVTLLEARSHLGGRASTWQEPHLGVALDVGPHLVAGAFRELARYARRCGRRRIAAVPRPVVLRSTSSPAEARLATGPGRARLVIDFARLRPLAWRERAGVARVLLAAGRGVAPDRPLGRWLDELEQGEAVRRWLWHPLAAAVFNTRPESVSASLFAAVLERLFLGGGRSFLLSYPAPTLEAALVAPGEQYLLRRGGKVARRARATRVEHGGSFHVEDESGRSFEADLVCLAMPARAAARLLGEKAGAVSSLLPAAAAVPHAPLVSVALWFEGAGPRLPQDFFGVVEGPFPWIFDRRSLVRGGAREPVVLVAPGDEGLARRPPAEIVEQALGVLEALGASPRSHALAAHRVVKELHAVPALTPEHAIERAPPRTAWPGLALAGDWTNTGLPATLEGAAASGHAAARALDAYAARGAWYVEASHDSEASLAQGAWT
jgi:zeta-carotene desaturase